LNQFLVM